MQVKVDVAHTFDTASHLHEQKQAYMRSAYLMMYTYESVTYLQAGGPWRHCYVLYTRPLKLAKACPCAARAEINWP